MHTQRCFIPIIIALTLTFAGCWLSRPVTTSFRLEEMRTNGKIRVLTHDSTVYAFHMFTFSDSMIAGIGTVTRGDSTAEFRDSIPFSSIAYIEGKMSGWDITWVAPAAVILGYLSSMASDPAEFHMARPTAGGGSCPYVYSYNGTSFTLDAETFGTSVSKKLEAETFHILPSLKPSGNALRIRLANERPETHLFNSVRLFSAPLNSAQGAVLDSDRTLWPVQVPTVPVSAQNREQEDISAILSLKDGVYWTLDSQGSLQSNCTAVFTLPEEVHDATLIISAINTDLINSVYSSIGTMLGGELLEFYYALEHDPVLQRLMERWIRDCGLTAEVFDGTKWQYAGTILPEANAVPFARAIRLRGLPHTGSPLKVRLSSLPGVWKLDAVQLDGSKAEPLVLRELPLTSLTASRTADARTAIAEADAEYFTMLPGESLDLEYSVHPQETGPSVYVISARGYLYEWLVTDPRTPAPIISAMTAWKRTELITLLLQEKELFFPPLYAQWRSTQ